jgi:hypothetical protein
MGENKNPRRTCRLRYGDRDVELGANDVILALGKENPLSREDAKRVARAVLEGFGHIYENAGFLARRKPFGQKSRIHLFPGKEPTIGLRRPE